MGKSGSDDYLKYLTSAGFGMMTLPLLMIHNFLKEPYDLLLSEEDMEKLTETAQNIIEERQTMVENIQQMLLIISAILEVLGGVVALFGLTKLFVIQFGFTNAFFLQHGLSFNHVIQLNSGQRRQQIQNDAQKAGRKLSQAGLNELVAIEERVFQILKDKYKKNYVLKQNVKIGSSGSFEVAITEKGNNRIVSLYKVVYVTDGVNIRQSLAPLGNDREAVGKSLGYYPTIRILIIYANNTNINTPRENVQAPKGFELQIMAESEMDEQIK